MTSSLPNFEPDQLTRSGSAPSNPSPYLHIEVIMVQVQLIFVPTPAGVDTRPLWQVYETGFQLAKEGKAIYSVKLDLSGWPLRGEETFDSLKTKTWDCIVLGETDDSNILSIHLMLIEWNGSIAERVGIATGSAELSNFVSKARQTRRRITLG